MSKIVQGERNDKRKTAVFQIDIAEPQPILSKDSAKNRFSEEKENKLSFLSVRFLFKSMKKQNKSPKTFIFFVEMQPILSKDNTKNRFGKGKEKKLSFLSVR